MKPRKRKYYAMLARKEQEKAAVPKATPTPQPEIVATVTLPAPSIPSAPPEIKEVKPPPAKTTTKRTTVKKTPPRKRVTKPTVRKKRTPTKATKKTAKKA